MSFPPPSVTSYLLATFQRILYIVQDAFFSMVGFTYCGYQNVASFHIGHWSIIKCLCWCIGYISWAAGSVLLAGRYYTSSCCGFQSRQHLSSLPKCENLWSKRFGTSYLFKIGAINWNMIIWDGINAAISAGSRRVPGSGFSFSISPAIVYLPAGTYLLSSIIDYYYTHSTHRQSE